MSDGLQADPEILERVWGSILPKASNFYDDAIERMSRVAPGFNRRQEPHLLEFVESSWRRAIDNPGCATDMLRQMQRLAEAMDDRAWKEFSDYLDIQQSVAIGSSGYANYDVGLEDYESPIDPYRLFQPFLDMPLPEDFDGEIAQLRNVRQNVGDAYVQIGGLRPDSSTWVSDTGDYFNLDYIPMLEMAAIAHMSLLEELERLLLTYRNLLEESLNAAKHLANGIIDKLNRPDAAVDFDFRTLLTLGLAAAGALILMVEPPVGFSLIVGGTSAALGILDAGKAVVQNIAVHGSTVREIMDSAKTAVDNLKEGLHEKGATLSRPLNRVHALISQNSARVAPAPPNLEPA